MSAKPNPPGTPTTSSTKAGKRLRRSTIVSPAGTITRLGIGGARWGDGYHALLMTTWPRFLGMIVVAYLLINVAFGAVYLVVGGVDHARAGNFGDAFFFSVQTMGTIGYGAMTPSTALANLVVTAESVTSMIGVALITGLIFAKFARPTARVMWSNVAVVARRDGVPTLMFRLANERSNQIVDAHFNLTVLLDEKTAEGEKLRRLHDLKLVRSNTPTFSLSFTTMHPIVEGSPLFGRTPEQLAEMHAQFIFTIMGMDDTMNAQVHARKSYEAKDIHWNQRFVDILSPLRDGERVVNYTRFHDVEPDGAET
jgi:inward rectifier potassium channel